MAEIGDVVYFAEMANGNITCKFTKTEGGYLREQTLSTGLTMEGDYTEEEFQQFLARVSEFDALVAMNKQKDEGKRERKSTRKK